MDSYQKDYANPQKFLIDLMKHSLVLGADKILMSRKPSVTSARFQSYGGETNCGDDDEEYLYMSKVTDHPSGGGLIDFPLNILSFFAIFLIKFIGFQIILFTSFFTLPIWLSYNTFIIFMFPFQTLVRIRQHLSKTFLRMFLHLSSSLINWLNPLSLALKFSRGIFWSIYVFLMLLGLLLSGFLVGSLVMRRVVEKPIYTREVLNFDYTKASPVAFVPVMSSPGGLVSKDGAAMMDRDGDRAIPYDHKLQLTVSLILPESEYNRNLGVFQVKVELMSANGKVTASSSYPTILKFKSKPVRLVETMFKTAPLIAAGFQSESQNLEIQFRDLTEGIEPTAYLKVVLEQRAEFQSGGGIPQIYSASLALESELPKMKNLVWYWRRTIFVWISLLSFYTELVVVLTFFRPWGRGGKPEKIYWKKGV